MRDCVLGVDLGCDGHWHGQLVLPPTDREECDGICPERVAYIECKIPDHVDPGDMVGCMLDGLKACELEYAVRICWVIIEKPEYQDDVRRSEIWVPKMRATAEQLKLALCGLPLARFSRETPAERLEVRIKCGQVPCATIRAALGVSGAKQDYMLKSRLAFMGYDVRPGRGLGNTNQRDAMAAALWWLKQNEVKE